MHVLDENRLSYDPYNVEIDADPYPAYNRLRDEAPLYYNETLDFWALSRFADVEAALRDVENLSSAKGDILEVVKAEPAMPLGVFINEDPPLHTVHRLLVSRAFTPRKLQAIENQVRAFCAACLDPLTDGERFDFTLDLGAEMPMRVVGILVGIPDSLQRTVRSVASRRLRNRPGEPLPVSKDNYFNGNMFREYVEWRAQNPSDDLVTELLHVEFKDVSGAVRRLSTDELLVFLGVIANAGTETVGRLFGWLGKLLGEHPDQRRELVGDPSLIPGAVEEVLRFEPPVHHIARYVANDVEYQGRTVPAGNALLLMAGSANRDERRFDDPERFDIHRNANHLSLGRGMHFCLGASLARLEGRVALEEILNRWPDWTIDMDNAVRAPTATVRGWDSMPAIVGRGTRGFGQAGP
jgi:cytochrome P450